MLYTLFHSSKCTLLLSMMTVNSSDQLMVRLQMITFWQFGVHEWNVFTLLRLLNVHDEAR